MRERIPGNLLATARALLGPAPAVVGLHRVATDNLGDRVASPVLHFDFLRSVPRFDLMQVPTRIVRRARWLVCGGGGLLDNDFFAPGWARVVGAGGGELIAWGVGHNRHGGTRARYPDFLGRFSLLGVRDYDPTLPAPFEWVPCVSCMHDAFTDAGEATTEIVCYEHHKHPLGVRGFPTLGNTERDFVKVVRFLASGDLVLTNSYHGMYWATLLGRRVIVFPFSSKFHASRHPAVTATADTWRSRRHQAVAFHDALEECRDANRRFAGKVRDRIDGSLR